jgi:uncharacterized repeat protein (TIGR02543 family)
MKSALREQIEDYSRSLLMSRIILLTSVENRKGEGKMKVTGVLTLFLSLALVMATTLIMMPAHAQNPVSFSVEPVAIAPLTDTNASINGLETPPTPSPIGKNFTVEIHVRGATVDNVANGVGGVEVHFNFTNILLYCQPTGFVDMTGQTGGVLVAPVLYGINPGFFKADGLTRVTTPPYTDAVLYKVAGASTGGPWNEADGLVVKINFTITKQPQSSLGEPDAFLQLVNSFTDLTDLFASEVNHDRVQGTLKIDATPQVQQNYTLTVNVVGSGSVAKNPSSATYASGTVVTLTASPAVNWTFQDWSGDLTGSQNPVNITMNGNKTVTATFVAVQPGQFTLTVNVVGSGSVAKNPSSATYASGTVVTLTASPAVNWTFQGWSGDLTGSQNPVNITMNGNKTVTATFVAVLPGQEFALTVNVVGSGSVAKNPSSATYASGTVVTLTASPAVNWTFHLWSGDLTGAQNPINITMDGNKTVTATFAKSGDFNDDGKVNLQDLTKLASWYGMNSTSPLWNVVAPPWGAPSAADFDHSGKLNLVDLVTLAIYYSTSPH